MRKTVSLLCITLVLACVLTVGLSVKPAHAQAWTGVVTIEPDGSVNPSSAPIQQNGDLYTLTGNIISSNNYGSGLTIERSGITLDGAGYAFQGSGLGGPSYSPYGVEFQGVNNTTVENIFFYGFTTCVSFDSFSLNNSLIGNEINVYGWGGIGLGSGCQGNVISENNISGVGEFPIFYVESSNNSIYHNNIFVTHAPYGLVEENGVNFWDDGYPSGGNYWAGYTGTDIYSGSNQNISGSDGIGDTPYVIDVNNTDHYPLTNPYSTNSFSTTISPGSAMFDVGQSQTFNSTVSGGMLPYTYQWFLNGTAVPGANLDSWILSPASGNYTAYLNVTDNADVTAISNTATLNVNDLPSVSILPSSVAMDVGQTQTFNSTVSGGTFPFTYQWYLNGTQFSGATSPTWAFTPQSNGNYQVYIDITDSLNSNTQSNNVSVTVNKPLVAAFTINPESTYVGQDIQLNASDSVLGWNGSQENPITSYLWDFGDGNVTSSVDSTMNHSYAYAGVFNVTLTISDSENMSSSCSNTVLVIMPTSVSVGTSATSTLLGYSVHINGTLSDIYGNPIGNEPVALYYTFPALSLYLITSMTTDNNGKYNADWQPAATGSFCIVAEWAGNVTYSAASSNVTMSCIATSNQYVFSVESNSTITGLAFNTTSQELSFTASGPSGTTGYAKVTIAKSLVSNITNIRVYLDNNQTAYSATSTDDSWLLMFNYTHSTHTVRVDLSTNAIPEFSNALILLLTLAAAVLVAGKRKLKARVHADTVPGASNK